MTDVHRPRLYDDECRYLVENEHTDDYMKISLMNGYKLIVICYLLIEVNL